MYGQGGLSLELPVMKRRCNNAILLKIATLGGGIFLGSLLYTTTALAAFSPLIMEVQPVYPVGADNPTQLVIYGEYFGIGPYGDVPGDPLNPDPQFTFGTYNGYLFIPEDQSLCDPVVNPPPAPLDSGSAGYSCAVVDLPIGAPPFDEIIPGDYLIEIWATSINLACIAKPSFLQFTYSPNECLWQNGQEFDCGPPATLPGNGVTLTATGHNNGVWAIDGNPSPWGTYNAGDLVTFTAGVNDKGQTKWPNEMVLEISGGDGGTQTIGFHTSCSQPLVIGDIYGSMTLTDMDTDALGPSTQHDEYDLTLGAVGPQGPTGPQGAQGKIGDTGEQGVQGKIGDTGVQGPTGPSGPSQPSGPVPGFDRYAIALSADQTIGTSANKYIGLGDTSNTH